MSEYNESFSEYTNLAFWYGVFAVFSIFVNILTQWFVNILLYSLGSYTVLVGLFAGTFTGLVTKYVLDKKYIFKYQTKTKKHNLKTFFLYSAMGLVTTFIFWGFELMFHIIVDDDNAKYLGGIIGLVIGYIIKYFLDSAFVFKEQGEKK